MHYYLTDLKLKAHETRAIDLRKLRDAQKEDFKKNKIPAAATDGSVSWIRLDNVPVMGRVVVLERRAGVASNYDCGTCYCPAGYSMCSISPTSVTGIPGDTQQFTATATFTLCNGVTNYYNVTAASTWGSTYPTVATVNTTGFATAVDGGSTWISVSHTDTSYRWFVADQLCNEVLVNRGAGATCAVQKPTFLLKTTQLSSNSTCSTQGTTTCVVQRFYRVLDANQFPINRAGLVIRETVTPPSGTCSGTVTDGGQWTTDASGIMTSPDIIFWCCAANSNCFVSWNQQFDVNFYPVLIIDGSGLPPGARNVINVTCSSGLGSCPQISVQP